MGVEIKVTTQELRSAAANIRGITDRIQNLYARISEEALKFPAQWEGEAEATHRRKLQEALDRANKAGDELKKRPDRLLVITGLYEQTEQQNVGSAQALDSNVIS
jgi:WXG100 family type VII secretion target